MANTKIKNYDERVSRFCKQLTAVLL